MQIILVLLVLGQSEVNKDDLVVFWRQVFVAPKDIVWFEISMHNSLLGQNLEGTQQRPENIDLVFLFTWLFGFYVLLQDRLALDQF